MSHLAPDQPLSWLTAAQLRPSPAPLQTDWLFDRGSLTRRLIALSESAFGVVPLEEGWQTLRPDECRALDVAEGSQGWVREVYLLGQGQPWVFARSVAARAALLDSGLDLATLGNRSLGELLFSDAAFARGALEVCRYPADWLPPEARTPDLWARRSRFVRDGLAVLVAEVFLPALWQRAGAPPSP